MRDFIHKYIYIIVGGLIFWLVLIPLFFTRTVSVVCENLTYNTPFEIIIKKPRLYTSLIPTAFLKAEKITIKSKNNNDKYEFLNPKINLRILPLISGKIHINDFYLSEIIIESKTDNENLSFYKNSHNLKIICDKLKIDNLKVNIKDNAQNTLLTGKNIYYKNNINYLDFSTSSLLKINNETSNIDINFHLQKNKDIKKSIVNCNITNLNIKYFEKYLSVILPKNTTELRGIVDISTNNNNVNFILRKCALINKDSAKSIILPKILNIESYFKITNKFIQIKDTKILSDNINVTLNGDILEYLTKQPKLDLNLQINKSKVEDIIDCLPDFKTEDIDAYKLKKYRFFGDVIGNLNIKGNFQEPNIAGDVFINNGVLTKPIPNAKGATIKLKFLGKYLNYDVVVPASATEKVWVKGGVELYNVKYADMRVWSTKHVDLAIAEEKVVPIHEILNFIIGPVPIMDIKGSGNIDITIKGNRKNPHVWGIFNVNNTTANFIKIPDFILTKANAELKFDDENAIFTLLSGFVNNQPIKINGTSNLDGKFDFDVSSNNQNLTALYKSLQTSTMIDDLKNMTPKFDTINGNTNLKLKVYGHIKDIYKAKFNKNFYTKLNLEFLGNSFSMQGIELHDSVGNLTLDNTNANILMDSKIGKSELKIKADLLGDTAKMAVSVPKLNLRDLIKSENKIKEEYLNILTNVDLKYEGNIIKIEPDKINLTAKIINNSSSNKLILSDGAIIIKNNKLNIQNLTGSFLDTKSSFKINLKADSLSNKPIFNGKVTLKDFELSLINILSDFSFIPENIKSIVDKIQFKKGKININANISNNNVNASTNLGGIELLYVPNNLPAKIVNGSIYLRRNKLGLNKINVIANDMPVLIDGNIDNIFTTQNFDLYINSKPKQDFIDKYFNNNRIYPLKLKGDIVYTVKIRGTKDDFNIESRTDLAKDSSIYYLGATVGDIENSIILNLNMNIIKRNLFKIKEFSYDKLIASQGKRTTRLNMLKANGNIKLLKNDISFQDFKIKTTNPTDAKIFNILFRKPNIKKGQFTSDLRFNGNLLAPKINGSFKIVETDIPFWDTTMKTLSFVFKDKTIELESVGEIMGNDIRFKGILKNSLTIPYYIEKAELTTKVIDFNNIAEKLKTAQVSELGAIDSLKYFDITNTIIKNMVIQANEIKLRNLTAEKITANASLDKNNTFSLKNIKLYAANGSINGNFSYNLKNNKMDINLIADNINANDLSIALFDLKNQIYGDLTGSIQLNCTGENYTKCMQTLNGSTDFNVNNGRMPKLGSLEYLLKAGNIVKGGFTGLSLNNLIDVLTPLKTGNFSNIYGTINIKDGIADDIEIATRGKDLSLFITGKYNFASSIADMEVLGILSKKISTLLGPVGNMSLNTLLNIVPGIDLSKNSSILDKINKIPGIELNEKAFRKFIAEINGNINSDDYVKSFKWIN